jgi:hypothetical protein
MCAEEVKGDRPTDRPLLRQAASTPRRPSLRPVAPAAFFSYTETDDRIQGNLDSRSQSFDSREFVNRSQQRYSQSTPGGGPRLYVYLHYRTSALPATAIRNKAWKCPLLISSESADPGNCIFHNREDRDTVYTIITGSVVVPCFTVSVNAKE